MQKKIFAGITIILILICVYWYGGSSESSHGWTIRDKNKPTSEQNVSEADLGTGDVVDTEAGSEITDIDDTEASYEADLDSDSDLDSSGNLRENDVVVAASASEAPVSEDNNNKEKVSNNKPDNTDEKNKLNRKDKSNTTIKDKKKDKKSLEKEVKSIKNNKSDSNEVPNNENEANQDNNTVNSEPGSVNAGISESTVINTDVPAKIPTKAPVKAPSKAPAKDPTKAPLSTPTPSVKTCVISINCSDILKNMDMLVKGKKELVPSDGLILEKTAVTIKKGDTVFDILKRVADEKSIHLEYSYTPIYGNYYVEGIANIYEFDCGDMSGWLYSVNDETISEGMSACEVSEGDVIKIWYTCDYTS